MKYQASDGTMKERYKHSFGPDDLDALARFLRANGGPVPLREIARGTAPERAVALRHDVDHNLEFAMLMARWEYRQGFRATYFVLPGQWYAQEPNFGPLLRELVELGHEVGIHNNVVAMAWKEGDNVDGTALPGGWCEPAAALMRQQLAFLRSFGIEVVGSAGHGTALYYSHGVDNLDLWAVGYRPEDFGLLYEAYHLHRQAFYISDNHGRWTETPLRVEPGLRTHVLTHPCHWALEGIG